MRILPLWKLYSVRVVLRSMPWVRRARVASSGDNRSGCNNGVRFTFSVMESERDPDLDPVPSKENRPLHHDEAACAYLPVCYFFARD